MKEALSIICAILIGIGTYRHYSRGNIVADFLGMDTTTMVIGLLAMILFVIAEFIL